MPRVRQGRPSAAEIEPRASFRWINGGAYADMGAWAKWGGRRHEPLVAPGEIAATKDPKKAALLFAERLAELRGRRELAKAGLPAAALDAPTSIRAFIGFHLAAKAEVTGRRRPCEQELRSQRTRLLHAAKFFRTRGIRDLRQLDHGAVEVYMEHLKTTPGAGRLRGRGGRSRGLLDPADGSPPFPRRVPRRAKRRLAECAGRNRACGRIRARGGAHHPVQAHVRDAPRLHLRRVGTAHVRSEASRGDGPRFGENAGRAVLQGGPVPPASAAPGVQVERLRGYVPSAACRRDRGLAFPDAEANPQRPR